jgi:hypothetical protein
MQSAILKLGRGLRQIEKCGRVEVEDKDMDKQDNKYPIRLILGIGNNMAHGFSIIFEKENGNAGNTAIWFDEKEFQLVKFTDGESYIIGHEEQTKKSFLEESEIIFVPKKIYINRNYMNK